MILIVTCKENNIASHLIIAFFCYEINEASFRKAWKHQSQNSLKKCSLSFLSLSVLTKPVKYQPWGFGFFVSLGVFP